jgi:hypothetical protein
MITQSDFNRVSQLSHFSWAALVVLAAALWHRQVLMAALIVVVSAVKEGWWDQHFEAWDVRGSSWLDFGVACAGVAFALVLLWIAPR